MKFPKRAIWLSILSLTFCLSAHGEVRTFSPNQLTCTDTWVGAEAICSYCDLYGYANLADLPDDRRNGPKGEVTKLKGMLTLTLTNGGTGVIETWYVPMLTKEDAHNSCVDWKSNVQKLTVNQAKVSIDFKALRTNTAEVSAIGNRPWAVNMGSIDGLSVIYEPKSQVVPGNVEKSENKLIKPNFPGSAPGGIKSNGDTVHPGM